MFETLGCGIINSIYRYLKRYNNAVFVGQDRKDARINNLDSHLDRDMDALCGFELAMQLLAPGFPKMAFGTWSGNWLIIVLIASDIPVLPFMNVTTLIIHLIAFAFGALAAFGCWLLGMR